MIADAVGSFFTAFGSSERLVQAVASTGPWGPFVFVLFQALQVVVAAADDLVSAEDRLATAQESSG